MKTAIENLGANAVLKRVKSIAEELEIPVELGIDIVCSACCNNSELVPSKRSKQINTDEAAITAWVHKFYKGYNQRPSMKTGTPPKTKPDPAVSEIIRSVIPSLTNDRIKNIEFAHRLSMSAENLLGPFVEEYIYERLKSHGWAMAWGETVRSVDLCGSDGRLIQIKNRSNTENSSSNKIRAGTEIQKWYRVDATTGSYLWDDLCDIVGVDHVTLSETDFRSYVKIALASNPNALGIDADSPFLAASLDVEGQLTARRPLF